MALGQWLASGYPVPTLLPACPKPAEGREKGVVPLSLWERAG